MLWCLWYDVVLCCIQLCSVVRDAFSYISRKMFHMQNYAFKTYFLSFRGSQYNFPGRADFIGSVGKGETNNILILALVTLTKCKKKFEDILNRTKDISKSPR